jgi:hypothetical protein
MKIRMAALTLLCALALVGEARAQVVWDSPMLVSPRTVAGTGLYLVEPHRAGLGILGTWRGAPHGLGFRLGVADGGGDGIAVLGGVDMVAPLATVSPDFPLDLSWYSGIGAGYDRWLVVTVPLGLTIGRTFGAPDLRFTPYLSPRLVADAHLDRDPPDERNRLRLGLAVDLGVDLAFQPGWTIRFGAGLGDRGGIGIGIIF